MKSYEIVMYSLITTGYVISLGLPLGTVVGGPFALVFSAIFFKHLGNRGFYYYCGLVLIVFSFELPSTFVLMREITFNLIRFASTGSGLDVDRILFFTQNINFWTGALIAYSMVMVLSGNYFFFRGLCKLFEKKRIWERLRF